MKLGKFRSDDDGHNYLVPLDKLGKFDKLYKLCYSSHPSIDTFEAECEFNNFAGSYRIDSIREYSVVIPNSDIKPTGKIVLTPAQLDYVKEGHFKCDEVGNIYVSFTGNYGDWMEIILNDDPELENKYLKNYKDRGISLKNISDGYHTFQELYDFRLAYNALLFNEWGKDFYHKSGGKVNFPINAFDFQKNHIIPKYNVHKSWKHHDGEWCFGKEKEWFIVSAMLPTGLISNHYKAKHWDKFKVPEVDKALFPYDGHTSEDVLDRLLKMIK